MKILFKKETYTFIDIYCDNNKISENFDTIDNDITLLIITIQNDDEGDTFVFPDNIVKFSKLEILKLQLEHMNYVVLPKTADKMFSLTTFCIENLVEIPDGFDKFPNLKVLDLFKGSFTQIPESLINSNITDLSFEENTRNIQIPKTICNFKKLEYINFDLSAIYYLPAELFNIPTLKLINCNYTNVAYLPFEIQKRIVKKQDTDYYITSTNKKLIILSSNDI
jgi:hypothetical protein